MLYLRETLAKNKKEIALSKEMWYVNIQKKIVHSTKRS
jgi:hypothetical protein